MVGLTGLELCRDEYSLREIFDLQVDIEIPLKKTLMTLRHMGENQKYIFRFSFVIEFLLECRGGYFSQEHFPQCSVRISFS